MSDDGPVPMTTEQLESDEPCAVCRKYYAAMSDAVLVHQWRHFVEEMCSRFPSVKAQVDRLMEASEKGETVETNVQEKTAQFESEYRTRKGEKAS